MGGGYGYSYSYSSSVSGQGWVGPRTLPYILKVFPSQLAAGPHSVLLQIKDGTGAVIPSGAINFNIGGNFGSSPGLGGQASPPSLFVPPSGGSAQVTITLNSINNLHTTPTPNPTIQLEANAFPGASIAFSGTGVTGNTVVLNAASKTVTMTVTTTNVIPGQYNIFFKAKTGSVEFPLNIPVSVVGSNTPTLLLNPPTVNPGSSVTFDGFNFTPGATVTMTVSVPPAGSQSVTISQYTVGQGTNNAQVANDGHIQGTALVPSGASAGTYPVTLTDSSGKSAQANLSVFDAGASDFQLNVSPPVLNLPPPPPPGQTQNPTSVSNMEVSFSKIGSFNSAVTIQVQGLPPGVTVQFDNNNDNNFSTSENSISSPTVGTTSAPTKVKFITSPSTPFGFFPVSIQGSSGSTFKFIQAQISIPPPTSFQGSGSGGIGVFSLNPPAGPTGTSVSFNGIAPSSLSGKSVTVRIAESTTNLATTTVGSDGSFSGTITIPSSFTAFGGVTVSSPAGNFPIKAFITNSAVSSGSPITNPAGPTLFADFSILSGSATYRASISPLNFPPIQQGGTSSALTVTATSIPGKAGGTITVAVKGLPPGMQVKFDSGSFGTSTSSTMTLPAGGTVTKAVTFQAGSNTPPGPIPLFIEVSLSGGDKYGFPLPFGVIPNSTFQNQFGFSSVFLSKQFGTGGDDLTITASGFAANSNLQVFFGGLPSDQISFSSTPTTDSSGGATIPIKVPTSLGSGTYPVRVRDATSKESGQPFTIVGSSETFSVLVSPSFLPPMQQGDNPSPNTVSVTVNVFSGKSLPSDPVVSIKGLPPGIQARFDGSGSFSSTPSKTLSGISSGGTASTVVSFKVSDTAPPGPFSAFVDVSAGSEKKGQPLNSGIIPKANFFSFVPTAGAFNAFTVGTVFVTPSAVSAGDTVTVSASGFTVSGTPQIEIGTFPSPTPINLPSGTTFDSNGAFSQQVKIPSSVSAGQYDFRVKDGTRFFASTRITVVGASDLYKVNVSPEFIPPAPQGGSGEPMQVTVTGLTGKNAGTVTLSLFGLPSGVTASFDGSAGTTKTLSVGTGGTASTQLTFAVGNTVPPGPIHVALKATSSAGSQTIVIPIHFGVRPNDTFANLFGVGSVVISPTVGTTSDSVSITASGFTANAPVTIIFGGNPSTDTLQLPSGTAFDSAGSFSTTLKVPSSLGPGMYPVTVSDGTRSDSKPFMIVGSGSNFDVNASPPFFGPVSQGSTSAASVITVNSLPGKAAGTVTLTVLGLSPGVTVSFDGTPASGSPPTKTISITDVGASDQTSMTLNVASSAQPGGPFFIALKASDGTTSRIINMGFGVMPSGFLGTQFGSLIVSPPAGKAGDPVTISASGFTAGNSVTLTFGGGSNLASGLTFDSSGAFSTTIKVPSTLGVGFYPIKISDGPRSEVRMFNVIGSSQKFQLTASPQFLPPVLQGDTSNPIVATVSSVSGQDSPAVTVKIEGLPPGMSLLFDGSPATSKTLDPGTGESLSTSIQIVTTGTTPPRPYPLQLTAQSSSGEFRSLPIGFGVMPKIGAGQGFASLMINPSMVSPGDTVTLTGTGYSASTTFSTISVAAPGQPTPTSVSIGTTVTVGSDGTWNTQIKLPSSVNPGFYRVLVSSGTGAALRTAEAPLNVIPSSSGFFNIGLSPDFVSIKQGDATGATTSLSVQSANAFNSALNLKVSGLPPGMVVTMKNSAGATIATFTGKPTGTTVSGTPIVTPDAGGTTAVSLTVTAGSTTGTGPYLIFISADQNSGASRGRPLAVQVTPSSGDSLVLSPNQGPSASSISVTGTGFTGSETVTLTFGGVSAGTSGFAVVPTTVTATSGSFSAQLTVPSLNPGVYVVKAVGGTSGKTLTTQFQLIPSSASGSVFMQIAPKHLLLPRASSGTQTITLTPIGAFNSAVTLSVAAPSTVTGVSASLSPSNTVTLTPGIPTPVSMTVTTTSSATLGDVPLTITATSGSTTIATESAIVKVVGSGGDYALFAAPKDPVVVQGSTATSNLQVIAAGLTGTPTFTVTGLPTGVTGSVGSISAVDSSGIATATLTLTASSSASVGTTAFTVSSSLSGQSKSTSLSVTVASSAPTTFTVPPFDPSSLNDQTPLPLDLNFGGSFSPTLTIKSLVTSTSDASTIVPKLLSSSQDSLGTLTGGNVGVGTNILNIEPSSPTDGAKYDMCLDLPSTLPSGVSASNVKVAFLDTSQTPPTWTTVTTTISGSEACASGLDHFSSWSLIASTTSTPTPTTTSSGGGGGGGASAVPLTDITTTTYPDSYFATNPLAKIQFSESKIVDAKGAVINSVKAGQQISFASSFKNFQQKAQPYAYIVQITDKDGVTVDVSWQTGVVDAGKTVSLSKSWTTGDSGTYHVKVFVWNKVTKGPVALSESRSTTLVVR